MASIYDVKPKFQDLLRPIVVHLQKAGVTPNQVTIAALAGSIAAGLLSLRALEHAYWLAVLPVWLFVRMALNAIDGMLAREYNMRSTLGAVLNETGDVLSDAALYLPLAAVWFMASWAVFFFVLGAVLSEFCGILGQALGGPRRYEGPMGKSDRAFFVGALALVTALFPQVYVYWDKVFWLLFVLVLWTGLNRIVLILKEAEHA